MKSVKSSPSLQSEAAPVSRGEDFPSASARTGPCRADVRLIAATNRDLEEMAREGKFRSDLLFRLRAVEIRLPALRERREDVPLLSQSFLKDFAPGERKDGLGVRAGGPRRS